MTLIYFDRIIQIRKTCLVFILLLVMVQSASATVIWNGTFHGNEYRNGIHDFVDPSGNYGSYACLPQSDSLVITSAPGRSGHYAGYFKNGLGASYVCGSTDQHNTIGKLIPTIPTPYSEFWYGYSLYLDNWVPSGTWAHITYINSYYFGRPGFETENNRGISMNTGGTTRSLYMTANRQQNLILSNFEEDKWMDFAIHVKLATDNTGFLEVYLRKEGESSYTKIFSRYNYQTYWEGWPADNYKWFIAGMYRGVGATTVQSFYGMDYKVGTTMADVTYGDSSNPDMPDPYIASWGNTKTNNNDLTFNLNTSESVTLNYTANQTITDSHWTPSAPNLQSFTISFSTIGTKTVSVYGSNANGSTQIKTWTITVTNQTTPPEPVTGTSHKYGINGNAISTLNSIRNHTTSNKGDGTETIGEVVDNCNDGTSDWTNSWTCQNGVLTSPNSTRTSTRQNIVSGYKNISLFVKTNETTLNLWEIGLRYDTSRNHSEIGYQIVRPAESTNLIIQKYNGTWNILATGTYSRVVNTPYYYIVRIVGNNISVYASTTGFNYDTLVVTYLDSEYSTGNNFKLDGSNVTFDDIRLINLSAIANDTRIFDTSDAGNTTVRINVTGCPAALGTCKLEWRQKFTGSWIVLNASFTGNLSYPLSNNQNLSNEVRVTLNGNSTSFPNIDSVEFVQGAVSSSSTRTVNGTYTICYSGCNATWNKFTFSNLTQNQGDGTLYVSNTLTGAVSQYKFDENTGTTTADQNTTNANTLTLVNTPLWTAGKYSYGLQFDGSDYATNSTSSGMPNTYPLSVTMWINKSSTDSWDDLFRKNGSWAVQLTSSGYLSFEITDIVDKTSTLPISLNQWTHVAVTWDGVSVKFYKNGVLTSNVSATNTPNVGDSKIFIGGGASGFNGKIDGLWVFDRVLTNDEVNITRDNTEYSQGSFISSYNAGSGNETYQLLVDASQNFTVSYRLNNTDNYNAIGSTYTGYNIITIPSNLRFPDTQTNITILDGYLSSVGYDYQSQTSSPTSTGYISKWEFENTTGTIALDENTTSNNHGTLTGSTYWSTNGKYGNAVLFNGSNGRIDVNSSSSLNMTSQFTLMAYVKRSGVGGWQGIIGKGETAQEKDHNYYLELDTTNRVLFAIGNGTGYRGFLTTSAVNTEWHHIAAVFNTTTDMKIYVDGILQSGVYEGNAVTALTPNTKLLTIGDVGPTGDGLDNFSGLIDEVAIYNWALTNDEINQSMGNTTTLYPPSIPINPYSEFADECTGGLFLNCFTLTWQPNNTAPNNITDSYNIYLNDELISTNSSNNWAEQFGPAHSVRNFSIQAHNNSGTGSNSGNLTYNFTYPNRPVTISGIENLYTVKEGWNFSDVIDGMDVYDSDTINYSDNDDNITTNLTTGFMNWTITEGAQGNYSITIWADDGFGSNVSKSFILQVENGTPTIYDVNVSVATESESPPAIYYPYLFINSTNIDYFMIVVNKTAVYNSSVDIWTNMTVLDNTNHSYDVRGYSVNLSTWTPWVNDTYLNVSVPPWQVSGLTAVSFNDTMVNLTWDNSSINDTDTHSYEGFIDGVHLFYTTNLFYNVTGLSPLYTYNFTVRANDTSNNWGENSTMLEVTMDAEIPTIVSYSPTDLTPTIDVNNLANFSANSSLPVTWTWTGVTEGAGDGTTNSTASNTWATTGAKTVTVTCSNANGSCGTIQWDVTVVSDGSGGGTNWDWLSGTVNVAGSTITTNPNVGSTSGGAYTYGYVFVSGQTYWINVSKAGYYSNNTQITFNEDHEIWNPILTAITTLTWWNSITNDDSLVVHAEEGTPIEFGINANNITNSSWVLDGSIQLETSNNFTTTLNSLGVHTLSAYGNTTNGTTITVTWRLLSTRVRSGVGDERDMLNETWFDSLTDSMNGSSPDFTQFMGALVLPYTTGLGSIFYVFIYLLPLVIIWIRQEKVIIPAGLLGVFGLILIPMLPAEWRLMAGIAVILTSFGVVYSLFKERG